MNWNSFQFSLSYYYNCYFDSKNKEELSFAILDTVLDTEFQHIGIRASTWENERRWQRRTKNEERFEVVEQEISEIRADLQKLPVVEEKLSLLTKNIERLSVQSEKQQQQHQMLIKYIESIIKEKWTMMRETEGSSNKTKMNERQKEVNQRYSNWLTN